MELAKTMLYEDAMKLDFLEEITALPGGEKIKHCIQCGTCSGSCPVSWAMEEAPRKIFALIRAGLRDKVLDSTSIWTCASCYQCTVRCPQQIKITDVMYGLKRLAMREGRKRSGQAQVLARAFIHGVNHTGRNREVALMMRYVMATNPFGGFGLAPIGMALWSRGRLPLGGPVVRDLDNLRKIVGRCIELANEAAAQPKQLPAHGHNPSH